jgi:hypothetical protein
MTKYKSTDLDILKVKSELEYSKKFDSIHNHLIKPPFLGIINGSVRTGKSTLIMNLIYNKNFYKDKFDQIIYISPTSLNDLTLKHLAEDDDVVKITDKLDQLDEILKLLIEEKDKDEETRKEHYLIIFDDCLGFIKPKSYVSFLCSRYRHYKTSLLFTSQNFRSIGPIIRTNATFYLIFKTPNKKEYKKYVEEFSGIFEDFEKMYLMACSEPYNFLYLDLRNVKAYHNFNKLLAD